MLKWLFWLILVLVFWGIARSRAEIRASSSSSASRRSAAAGVRMVPCTLCQVHVPEDEAVMADGKAFCCEQHSRQWRRPA